MLALWRVGRKPRGTAAHHGASSTPGTFGLPASPTHSLLNSRLSKPMLKLKCAFCHIIHLSSIRSPRDGHAPDGTIPVPLTS
eukprot:scaffold5918_cov124-Isochrysis_galbana.AAC.19